MTEMYIEVMKAAPHIKFRIYLK